MKDDIYNYLEKFEEDTNEDKEIIKSKNFLVHRNSNFVKVNIKDLKEKAPLPV